MKKLILSLIAVLTVISSYGQDDVYQTEGQAKQSTTEFKALNGINYKIGDTIRLGRGSDPQGNFRYLEMGGWGAALTYDTRRGPEQMNIGRAYAGTAVVLKKIRYVKMKGVKRTYFVVGGGNITNYNLSINEAIESCEVTPCNDTKNVIVVNQIQETNLDKLKKLKELLDAGALTQAEYDEQKKKVLAGM